MIITRTPFRISFAGGGSDLPSFYMKEPGAVLSTTIDKYMYIVLHPFFNKEKIQLKYARTELVDSIEKISHPIFREVLKQYNLSGVDINSIADIPSGTGMGSSSSFTAGLLLAVRSFLNKQTDASQLAKEACEIEIEKVGSPIGKQDQYAAAFGGLNFFTFSPDGSVSVEKVNITDSVREELEQNLMLIYVGGKHSANDILKNQSSVIAQETKFNTQHKMVELAYELRTALLHGQTDNFGRILHEGWQLKRSLVGGISNNEIDNIYNQGIQAGALGGKLLGAGGAGFILFYCPKERQDALRNAVLPCKEMLFRFDNQGAQVIHTGNKF